MTILEAAISYAARGWPVLPLYGIVSGSCACGKPDCSSPGKHPASKLVPHGLKQATTDATTIARWFADQRLNVGIVTGAASGVWVLDVDGEEGWRSIINYEEDYGSLPKTLQSETGSGGHFFFAVTRPVANTVRLMPGVDVRGDGGYVVAPPSAHINRRYHWHDGHEPGIAIATAPETLLDRQAERRPVPVSQARRLPPTSQPIAAGTRNDTLFRRACAMAGKGKSPETIVAELQAVNVAECRPPLAQDEVERIARSASQYAPNKATVAVRTEPLPPTTLADRAAQSPTQRGWIVDGLIDATTLTELVGRPKVGKTTFVLDMIAAVTTGRPFLKNRRTRAVRVVYLAEESGKTLDASLARAGLTGSLSVRIIERSQEPWLELAERVISEAERWGAELLVIDSLGAFAVPEAEEENTAGWAARSLAPLLAAQARGLTILVVLHARKERGFEQARGSTRLTHDADNIFTLARPRAARDSRARELHYEGRYQEPVPGHYERPVPRVIRLRLADEYMDEAAKQDTADRVLAALNGAMTADEVQKIVGLRRAVLRAVLLEMVAGGLISRSGAGDRWSPYRYSRKTGTLGTNG